MTTMQKTFGFLSTLALAGALSACIPPGESGQCSSDEDCTGRGTVCELTTSECIPVSKDYSTTAEPSPPLSFSDKAIPFFRGRICSAPDQQVQTGSAVAPCRRGPADSARGHRAAAFAAAARTPCPGSTH